MTLIPTREADLETVASALSDVISSFGGYDALVTSLRETIEELDFEPTVIATGGLARTVSSRSRHIREVDPLLTLEGLRILNERTVGKKT